MWEARPFASSGPGLVIGAIPDRTAVCASRWEHRIKRLLRRLKRIRIQVPLVPISQIVAVQVHHLCPRRHEVLHELRLRIRARIDFRQGAQLRMRAEDQIDPGAGPFQLVRLPVGPS